MGAVAVLHFLEGKNYLIEWLCTAVMSSWLRYIQSNLFIRSHPGHNSVVYGQQVH